MLYGGNENRIMTKGQDFTGSRLYELQQEVSRIGDALKAQAIPSDVGSLLDDAVARLGEAVEFLADHRIELERLKRQEQTLLETVRYTRTELEKKIEEISLVRLVAENGIRSLMSENPLQFILEHVNRLTDAEHGSIMLLDPQEGRLYLAATSGPDRIPPYERSYKLGEGIARWVDTAPPLDSGEIEVLRESDEEHGSILCYPLIVDHTLVGVLSIGHSRPAAFNANTERILYIIASQVALAVYNAHLASLHQKQKTSLQISNDRYRSLVERVNDLLDLTRMETGSLRYEKKEVRLRGILTALRPQFKPRLRRKNIQMQVQIPKRIPAILGDEQRLRQAIHILLEDALKYSPEHGRIRLTMTIEDTAETKRPQVKLPAGCTKYLLFSLADTAPSIPHQLQGSIFEKLTEQEGAPAGFRGSRLSLYLAKEIIEFHDGQIWLESGDFEGNTYYFTLPIP